MPSTSSMVSPKAEQRPATIKEEERSIRSFRNELKATEAAKATKIAEAVKTIKNLSYKELTFDKLVN